MARLKSLTAHPPGSFQHLQPETGQTTPFVGSFNYVVEQVILLRTANPFLCERHGWRTDTPAVEAEVEAYNVARCIAGGWLNFLQQDDPNSPMPTYTPPPEKKKRLPVVGAVRNVAAGIGVLLDWLGSGGKPVDAKLAEARGAVCVGCPKNDGGDYKAYFTTPVAEKIRTQLEVRNDLQLRTTHDERLTVCSACDCPLALKVWAPLEHILAHTSEKVKADLDARCWITAEAKELS
jgi:hypothetical protein